MKYRKGQFFVLGAVLIISLFFMGLPEKDTLITERTDDIAYLFDNIHREYPFALNNALNMSEDTEASIDRLMNFTHFVDKIASERLINYSTLWVIGWNSSPSNFNVTVGNYLRYNTVVLLNLSGTEYYMNVNFNTTNSTEFTSVSDTFDMIISYESEESNVTWVRDKVSLYANIIMQRKDNIIKNELSR
ncbi:MAG: hypothetical protein KKC05_03705 [Nanoarchaeota archaeon]|nr:hypothetical protein [Nanoarchaeota archaeon]